MNPAKLALPLLLLASPFATWAATLPPGEVVVSLPNAEASGVVVTPAGRTFLTLPRAGSNHNEPSVVEIIGGKPVAFPDAATTVPSNKPLADWIVSPLGMTLSGNTLWVLDEGKRAGVDGIPDGSAKLLAIDIDTRKITRTIFFKKPFMRDTIQLNDLRVDMSHGKQGTVYISNNGFAKPDNSLIVVDIASGKMREIFRDAPETSPAPGFMTYVEGQPHAYSVDHATMPQGGANGIELSPDNKTLYWTIPTNPNYYSIATADLSNFNLPESALKKATHFEGQTASNGGITVDDKGSVYFGDASRYSIIKKDTHGKFSLVATDPRLIWPDGLYYRNGYVYVSVGQWQRAPGLNGGKDLRKPPYEVLRFKAQ
ncbi:MAG: L-dopachrome tautomerase-related protein [Pseudomonas sp.]|uniref:major royal jelly family protein n=1 Tax=Pseudomonas abieticivorans TaxID=2931382 RepID=UPI0020BE3820|nr:major royal jelly family protein [Pseudomonas sp. PIA16]MDE1168905.1 L-dopachrome tautomerase-related protein [Pseudomonas sp.]